MEHIQHYAKLHEQGKLFHGGPYLDIDSGDMMITTAEVTREEPWEFATPPRCYCQPGDFRVQGLVCGNSQLSTIPLNQCAQQVHW